MEIQDVETKRGSGKQNKNQNSKQRKNDARLLNFLSIQLRILKIISVILI
jgi:hypothetical protein